MAPASAAAARGGFSWPAAFGVPSARAMPVSDLVPLFGDADNLDVDNFTRSLSPEKAQREPPAASSAPPAKRAAVPAAVMQSMPAGVPQAAAAAAMLGQHQHETERGVPRAARALKAARGQLGIADQFEAITTEEERQLFIRCIDYTYHHQQNTPDLREVTGLSEIKFELLRRHHRDGEAPYFFPMWSNILKIFNAAAHKDGQWRYRYKRMSDLSNHYKQLKAQRLSEIGGGMTPITPTFLDALGEVRYPVESAQPAHPRAGDPPSLSAAAASSAAPGAAEPMQVAEAVSAAPAPAAYVASRKGNKGGARACQHPSCRKAAKGHTKFDSVRRSYYCPDNLMDRPGADAAEWVTLDALV